MVSSHLTKRILTGIGNASGTPRPLWLKISIALLCAMAVVAYTTVRLGHDQRATEIGNQLKAQSLRTLEMFSAGVLESVIQDDVAVVDKLIKDTVSLDPDLFSVRVTNALGDLVVHWVQPEAKEPEGAYAYQRVIDFEGEVFGEVAAVWSPARLIDEVNARLALEQSRMIAALLTLTALSLLLLHVLVTAPLSKLRRRLQLLSADAGVIPDLAPLALSGSQEMQMLSVAVDDLGRAIDGSRILTLELEHQANHDYLTGLKSRSSFEASLNNYLSQRTLQSPEGTVIFFDLDQFKLVNDTCGHAAGDTLLVQLSTALREHVGPGDAFARLGGDEFAILLPDTGPQQGMRYAEHLRGVIERFRFSCQGRTFAAEASMGVVAISGTDNRLALVMRAADAACYAAKHAGRNRVHLYEESDEQRSNRERELNWVPRIREAIEVDGLVLFGQVIEATTISSTDSTHIEILVRLRDEQGKLIPPGAFLPAAERFGLAPHIDRWVVTKTFAWMAAHLERAQKVPVCAINISGASVCDVQFREFLLSVLAEHRAFSENVCLEITETAAVAELGTAIDLMHAVKQYGCSFALDDFGAGMSSFTYLKNLPVDFVKIDGAFVKDLLNDDVSVAMVKAIADISRVMKIESIAEFVENDAIRAKLRDIGIDYVQGYGVGMPQPIELFEQDASLKQLAA